MDRRTVVAEMEFDADIYIVDVYKKNWRQIEKENVWRQTFDSVELFIVSSDSEIGGLMYLSFFL